MDFELSPEDAAFKEEVRAWLADHASQIDSTKAFAKTADPKAAFERYREWEKTLFEGGWAGVAWPKEFGGRGATLVQQAIFTEEYARAQAPDRINRLGLGILGPTLMVYGTDEQKTAHLANVLACDEIWCQGFSEPGSGSDLASLRTKAVRDGDDFVINGQKVWTSLAAYADWIFLLVRTDPEAEKHQGISFILVDMKTPGVEVRPIVQINGSPTFCETFFTDVRVPASNVVDQVNNGWKVAMTALSFERGTALGSSVAFTHIWEEVVGMSKREQRYDAVASDDPDVRRRVAQGYIDTRVFELNTQRLLSQLGKGKPLGPEASLSKLYWSEMEARLYELGNDVLGPKAELARGQEGSEQGGQWFADYLYARASMIYGGTSEIQKNIIAQRVLELPKS